MKVLVTGANGMIGLATVTHFLERGYKVAALVRNIGAATRIDPRAEIRVLQGDWSNLQDVCSGCDAVVHLAAQRLQPEYEERGIEAYWLPNVLLTARLLHAAAAAGVKRFCAASSVSVYSAKNSSPYRESDYPFPQNFYGTSKLAAESLVLLYGSKNGMRVNCLRPSQVLGFDYLRLDGMLMTFLRRAAAHQPLTVWRQDRRDFVYVKDVAEAFERAVQPDAPEGIFNIGSGRTYSNSEIAEAVNRAFANPHPVRLTAGDSSEKSGGFMDISRAAQELGWRPRWELSAALMDMKNQLDRGVYRLPE